MTLKLTKAIAKALPAIYSTEKAAPSEKIAKLKIFNPCGAGTWYVFEADALVNPSEEVWMPLSEAVKKNVPYSDVKFFGYVTGLGCNEMGYFLLSEMQAVKGPFGIGLEIDKWYTPESLAEIEARG